MPPYHVLVADDDDSIRSLLARILVHTYPSVTVWAVKDGREALDIYDQQQLDLLISNYHMPRLDGLALLQTLRQSRQSTLPILMTSAHVTIEPQARALGVTAFLVKPFSIAQLTALLKARLPP